jgi:hypothetical protein
MLAVMASYISDSADPPYQAELDAVVPGRIVTGRDDHTAEMPRCRAVNEIVWDGVGRSRITQPAARKIRLTAANSRERKRLSKPTTSVLASIEAGGRNVRAATAMARQRGVTKVNWSAVTARQPSCQRQWESDIGGVL